MRIAQPEISRQIQKLEHELGTKLLERHGRGVQVTKSGFMLMERAEALLNPVEETKGYIIGRDETTIGNVVLGLPPHGERPAGPCDCQALFHRMAPDLAAVAGGRQQSTEPPKRYPD